MAGVPASSRGNVLAKAFGLTAVQLRAATATPVEIVAPPGANKVILLIGRVYDYTFVTTPYSNGGFDFALGSNAVGSIGSAANVLDQTTSQVIVFLPAAAVSQARSAMVNKPLVLATTLPGAILTWSFAPAGTNEPYAVNDTGTLSGGTGGTYIVTAVDGGGAPTALTITNPGSGYEAAGTSVLVAGGAQPGTGQGAAIFTDTVDASGDAGDGTLSGEVYYTVANLA